MFQFFAKLFLRLGFIAFLAGLAPTSIAIFDQLTCTPATARVESLQGARTAISFTTADGRPVRMLAYTRKIGLEFRAMAPGSSTLSPGVYSGDRPVRAGAAVNILYRGAGIDAPPYVSQPFSFAAERLGITVGSIGLVLLLLSMVLLRLSGSGSGRRGSFAGAH